MRMLDLFSGIGGFSLAASWVWGDEHEIAAFVESDPFCRKVLKKHWPDVPIISDIREYKHDATVIDLLTGGFPCQPFSVAGKRGGKADDRYLWPEMLRVIKAVRPSWIIGENVAGIINLELDRVLSDLENAEYEVQAFVIPACAVGAPHRRDRVWILGRRQDVNDPESGGCGILHTKNKRETAGKINPPAHSSCNVADTNNAQATRQRQYGRGGLSEPETEQSFKADSEDAADPHAGQGGKKQWDEPWIEAATRLCRVDDGVSARVDRLRSLGNAIVPQCVVPIMEAIKEVPF